MRRVAMLALALVLASGTAMADHKPLSTGAFEVTQSVVLPGTPEEIFDDATGDISGWRHHFLHEQLKPYVESGKHLEQ